MRNKTWTLLAMMVAMPAQALDIEPIEVRSAVGQPLLAEIPIQASAGELRELRASLAPSVVFARVGLPRPDATVANLLFVVSDTAQKPVIRVTTSEPVTEEFFTFLVQLEWNTGQMIREFSVALQEPSSLPIEAAPSARLPESVVSDPVAREPEPSASSTPIEVIATGVKDDPATRDAAPPAPPIPLQASSQRAPVPSVPKQAPTQAPRPPQEPRAQAPAKTGSPVSTISRPTRPLSDMDRHGPVKPGETLSHIASRFDDSSIQREQALVGLLLANPDAFIGGNMNALKQGVILHVPAGTTLSALDPSRARALVHLQIRAWREGRDAVPQSEMDAALASARADMQATEVAPVPLTAARLEIALPEQAMVSADKSGTGSMLAGTPTETELHQEALASRDAEIEYLKQRVGELEGSHDELQRIVILQDQSLATAQERLAETTRPTLAFIRSPWSWAVAALLLVPLIVLGVRRARRSANAPGPQRHAGRRDGIALDAAQPGMLDDTHTVPDAENDHPAIPTPGTRAVDTAYRPTVRKPSSEARQPDNGSTQDNLKDLEAS